MTKQKLLNYLFLFLISMAALMILYLSWVSSPKIGHMRYMPPWIGTWVDSYAFMAIRTAIPLILLGMLIGLYLNLQKANTFWWLKSWVVLSLLVVFAELGQYFRPMRSVDWKDVVWGSLGAALGLGMLYVVRLGTSIIKRKQK